MKNGCQLTGPIYGCICSYESDAGLQKHLDIIKITFVASTGRQFDHIKHQYAEMVSDELSKPLCRKSTSAGQNRQNVSNVKMGWALQKQNSSSRFPEKVKTYLNDRFLIGEETGNKASLTQFAREMRGENYDKGDRLFVGTDCLSCQQVAAYFSLLAAAKRKHGSLATTQCPLEEVEEFLNEEQIQEHELTLYFT